MLKIASICVALMLAAAAFSSSAEAGGGGSGARRGGHARVGGSWRCGIYRGSVGPGRYRYGYRHRSYRDGWPFPYGGVGLGSYAYKYDWPHGGSRAGLLALGWPYNNGYYPACWV